MTHAPVARPWATYLAAIATLLVAAVAIQGAIGWYGRPFPSILVDPDLAVSTLGNPTWQGIRAGLRFPDRIVAVEGQDLTQRTGTSNARKWEQAVQDAAREGRPSLHVRVETSEGTRELDLAIVPFDAAAWWLFAGGLFFIALLYVGVSVLAATASPSGRLARTFSKYTILVGLFLFTLFDYHTDRRLVPLFHVAFAWVSTVTFVLPLRLPSDVPFLARHPWLETVLDTAGAAFAAAIVLLGVLGQSTLKLRLLQSFLIGVALLFFGAAFVFRLLRARGRDREILRALLVAMVPAFGVIGLAFLLATFSAAGSTLAFCAVPTLVLLPFSAVFAFVRHDLWGSRALLSRPLTRVLITVAVSTFGIVVGTGLGAALGIRIDAVLLATSVAASVTGSVVLLALGVGDRKLFPSRAQYKPTIEQLSEELTSINSPDEVSTAIERTVKRWLPCERVQFLTTVPASEPETQAPAAEEEIAPTGDVTIPVRFRGWRLGLLQLGRKEGAALFTSEDLDLLRTIANQAALALAHANSYAELEQRRLQQARAWREERAALVDTLASEIAHEIRYPINFFRSLFRRGASGERLDAEEVDIGFEEVARLERLVTGLRRVTARKLERRDFNVRDLAAKCEILLRDRLGREGLRVELESSSDVLLRCDPDQVIQVLVNLLSNALDAAGSSKDVGVEWRFDDRGGRLVVWDRGPGFSGEPSQVFAPWFTTKPNGTGLGLAIAHRIVRSHGWTIDAARRDGITEFTIVIPNTDIVGRSPSAYPRGTTS